MAFWKQGDQVSTLFSLSIYTQFMDNTRNLAKLWPLQKQNTKTISLVNHPDYLASGPVDFRPHLTMGLAFYRRGFKLPTGKLCLLEAGHKQFEVLFHGGTSWIEVEGLVKIPTTDGTRQKIPYVKNNWLPRFRLQLTILDLKNETPWSGFLWYRAALTEKGFVHHHSIQRTLIYSTLSNETLKVQQMKVTQMIVYFRRILICQPYLHYPELLIFFRIQRVFESLNRDQAFSLDGTVSSRLQDSLSPNSKQFTK